jgi:hypothetical protein
MPAHPCRKPRPDYSALILGVAATLACLALGSAAPARAQTFKVTPLPELPPIHWKPISPFSFSQAPGWSCVNATLLGGDTVNLNFRCSYWYAGDFPADAYGPEPPISTRFTTPILYRRQNDSGQDRWLDHKVVAVPDSALFYVAAGFSRFVNWEPDEGPAGGCLAPSLPPVDCNRFDQSGFVDGGGLATLALIRGDGSQVWSHAYEPGFFNRVIVTADGGYLAIGKTYATLSTTADRLIYNPGQPAGCVAGAPLGTSSAFSPGQGCSLGGSATPHVLMVRTDAGGNVIWEYAYGMQPYNPGNPGKAYGASAEGLDVIETSAGNFILVGQSIDPASTPACGAADPLHGGRGFVIEVDPNGMWRSGSFLSASSQPNSSIVTGITRHAVDGIDHYVIGGMYTSARCHQRIFALQFTEPAAGAPPCPQLTVDWRNVTVDTSNPDTDPTDQNTYEIRLADQTDPNPTVLLPAVVSISGKSGLAEVFLLDSFDGHNRLVQDRVPIAPAVGSKVRLMISPNPDGGFAAATTVAGDPMGTDVLVAKYKADYTRDWQTTVDTYGAASDVFPGDQRKREGIFAITSDGLTGFVMSGYNSFNFEDAYMLRVTYSFPFPFP